MKLFVTVLTLSVVCLGFAGLAPVTATGDAPENPLVAGGEQNTFKMTVDPAKFDLDQGAKREVKISVDRGDNFKEDITVTIKPKEGSGITIDPEKRTLKTGVNNFTATFTAAKTAATGKRQIDVHGEGGGKAIKLTVDVNVTKAD